MKVNVAVSQEMTRKEMEPPEVEMSLKMMKKKTTKHRKKKKKITYQMD